MKINKERNKMSTSINREELIEGLLFPAKYWTSGRHAGYLMSQAADMLKADAERIAGYKEDQRELMSQMQAQQQEINELKANQAYMLEANAREIESIECDYTDQVLRAIEAEEKLAQQVAVPVVDMFWNHDNPEKPYSSISEFLNDEMCNGTELTVGDIRTVQRALRLPNIDIRITSINEDECDADYEIVATSQGDF